MAGPDVVQDDGRGGRSRRTGPLVLAAVLAGLVMWRFLAGHPSYRAAPPDGSTPSPRGRNSPIGLVIANDRGGLGIWDAATATRHALRLPAGAVHVQVDSLGAGGGFTVTGVAAGHAFAQNYSASGDPVGASRDLGPAVAVGGGLFSPSFTVLPGSPSRLKPEPEASSVPIPSGWSVRELAGLGADAIVVRAPGGGRVDVAIWSPPSAPVPIATGVHLVAVADGAVAWLDAACPADPLHCALHVTDSADAAGDAASAPNASAAAARVLSPPAGFSFLPAAGAWVGTGYIALFGQRITDHRPVVLYALSQMSSAQLVPGSEGADAAAGLVWAGKDLVFALQSSSTGTLTVAAYDFVADAAQSVGVDLPAGAALLCGC